VKILDDAVDEFSRRAIDNIEETAEGFRTLGTETDETGEKAKNLAKAQDDNTDATDRATGATERLGDAQQKTGEKTQQLTAEQQAAADQAKALDAAYRVLGFQSQATLTELADNARSAFETVRAAVKDGAATTADAATAFEIYARAALAAAENVSEGARRNIEAQLRNEAATVGATDALERLGLVGKQAGEDTADAATEASDALRNVADSAEDAAESVGGLGRAAGIAGSASYELSERLREAATEARTTSTAVDGVSQAYIAAVQAQSQQRAGASSGGALPRVQAELIRQTEELQRQLEVTRQQNAQYDETAQRVAQLRVQFAFLSDDRLQQLAQEQIALERNQRTAEANANREREQTAPRPQSPSPSAPSPDRASSFTAPITINVSGSVIGSSPSQLATELARLIAPALERLRALGAYRP
jgi:hypothetical protein